jgi:AraC-like DNA-binding protein
VGIAPIRSQIVRETPCLSLVRFDHPPEADALDTDAQEARHYQVAIVERGWFRLGEYKRKWLLGPGHVFVTRPGQIHSYTHFHHLEPDSCLCLNFKLHSENAEELPRLFGNTGTVVHLSNRVAFLHSKLQQDHTLSNSLLLEAVGHELLQATLSISPQNSRLYRSSQLAWYAERISAAREILETQYQEDHSLKGLASRVGMSPFLFARVFAELVGVPPHRFLVGVRLGKARWMLEQGASVTAACYAVGFNNFSHFTRTFRAWFGFVPSDRHLYRSKTKSLTK